MINISQIKEDITPKLHGTTINKVTGNLYRNMAEAARRVLARIDPKTTIRTGAINNALYSRIFDYIAPNDLKGNKIIDLRPVLGRVNFEDENFLTGQRQFDIKKYFNSMTVKESEGIKFLRISKEMGAPLTLHTCDSVTSDGTWVAEDDAEGLESDSYISYNGVASLRFNLSGLTGVGAIEVSDMSTKNIGGLLDKGSAFIPMYWPSAAVLPTNIKLRWGTDNSNYWEKTVTAPHEYTGFRQGLNLLRFDWATAVKTGTPNSEDIKYLKVIPTYPTGTEINGVIIDSITMNRAYPFEIDYLTNCLFKSASGQYKEMPDIDTDTVNLDGLAYNIFLYEVMDILAQILKAEESSFDINYFRAQLDKTEAKDGESGLYERYANQYPSEALVEVNSYYDMGYNRSE